MTDPAFEYLRKFKQVTEETEILVKKTIRRKYPDITPNELFKVFEFGLVGEYGKMYNADPQTLMSWIDEFMKTKPKPMKYLFDELLDPSVKTTDRKYFSRTDEWHKECNKAYFKYLKGTDPKHFHPGIYDRMMMDDMIDKDAFTFFLDGNDFTKAKQIAIAKFFESCKANGLTLIYAEK